MGIGDGAQEETPSARGTSSIAATATLTTANTSTNAIAIMDC